MDIVFRAIDFFRIVAGLFMVLIGGICYVLLGHLLLPQSWRDKLATGLYLPLAEACAGKRDWADLVSHTPDETH